jgi:hypothetical protein
MLKGNIPSSNGSRLEGRSTPPIATTLRPPGNVQAGATGRGSKLVEAARGALYGLAIVGAFVAGTRYGQSLPARPAGASSAEGIRGPAAVPALDAPLSIALPAASSTSATQTPSAVPPAAVPASSAPVAVRASRPAGPLRTQGGRVDGGGGVQTAADPVPNTGTAQAAAPSVTPPSSIPAEDPLVEAVRKDIAEEQSRQR